MYIRWLWLFPMQAGFHFHLYKSIVLQNRAFHKIKAVTKQKQCRLDITCIYQYLQMLEKKRLLAQKKINSLGQLRNYFANLHLNLQVNPVPLSPSSHTLKFGQFLGTINYILYWLFTPLIQPFHLHVEVNPNQRSVFPFVRSVTAEGEGDLNSDTTRHSGQAADTS